MPATFINNLKSTSPYYGFYINPNGSGSGNIRIFLKSEPEKQRLEGELNKKQIPYTLENGSSFLDALTHKADSPQRVTEINNEHAGLAHCKVIKIAGLDKMYAITRIVPYSDISTKEFYKFIKLATENMPNDFLQSRQQTLQQ